MAEYVAGMACDCVHEDADQRESGSVLSCCRWARTRTRECDVVREAPEFLGREVEFCTEF